MFSRPCPVCDEPRHDHHSFKLYPCGHTCVHPRCFFNTFKYVGFENTHCPHCKVAVEKVAFRISYFGIPIPGRLGEGGWLHKITPEQFARKIGDAWRAGKISLINDLP